MNTFTHKPTSPQAHKPTSPQAHKRKQFSGITGQDKVPKSKKDLFGTRTQSLNLVMLLFLGLFSVSAGTLQAQPTSCPDWSICIETDPDNCELTEISLNGLQNEDIAGLFLEIQVGNPNVTIDASATLAAFQSTDIGMHPWFSSSATVPISIVGNTIKIKYVATGTNAIPFSVTEECLPLGTIILDDVEDCDDSFDPLITITSSDPFSTSALYLGPNYNNSLPCPTFTLDCPCSEEVCPDDWGICFSETGDCNRVAVSITGLGDEDLAGTLFNINLDPTIPAIDEESTADSYYNQSWFGNLPASNISFSGNQITVSSIDVTGSSSVPGPDVFLMYIYFDRDPGECYSFSESTLSFGLSGVRIGDNIGDSERCDLPGMSCPGFELCCVSLAGNILRSSTGSECDEGMNYGFPEGVVEISSASGNFNTTTVETDEFGYYVLEVYENESYTVRPDYTADFLVDCGLNTADIAEIQNFILGLQPCFNNLDVGNAAANVDNDSNASGADISGADIIYLQQIILGIPTPEPVNTWQFMTEEDYISSFQSQACPDAPIPSYNQEDVVNLTTNSKTDVDFLAFKMGDVNGDCQQCIDPNALTGGSNIDLIAKWDKDRGVVEFSLDDPLLEGISVLAVAVDGTGLSDELSISFTDDSETFVSGRGTKGVGMVWSSIEQDGISFSQEQKFMEIPVDRSIKNLSELNLHLNVGEMMMNGQRYLFNLIVEESESAREDEEWSIYPNPATEFIHIRSSQKYAQKDIDLEILNTNGQRVHYNEGVNLNKNGNRISIHELPSGMFILRLRTADEEIQLPFVKIRP